MEKLARSTKKFLRYSVHSRVDERKAPFSSEAWITGLTGVSLRVMVTSVYSGKAQEDPVLNPRRGLVTGKARLVDLLS
jgi:hypothetical protein